MWQAFEIFLNNGKSYFFNFFKIKLCENAFKIFKVSLLLYIEIES